MNIILTGSSGYIGTLLLTSWLNNPKVKRIIAIDSVRPKFLSALGHPRIQFIQKDLADVNFDEIREKIDAVVHAAYLIRKPYFQNAAKAQERSNFSGAENIFSFAFKNNISKLIHFSSVAVYGATSRNTLGCKFRESDPVAETKIAYGADKGLIEKNLEKALRVRNPKTQVITFRPGSISGPFYKNMVRKSGLQSYLKAFPIIPITSNVGARQFVHESDVVHAVNFCLEKKLKEKHSVFNLVPQDHLTFKDIAKLLNKAVVKIPLSLARLSFNLMWHLSLGKIPSAPGTINSYSYPILADGSKISTLGFKYRYSSKDTFLA